MWTSQRDSAVDPRLKMDVLKKSPIFFCCSPIQSIFNNTFINNKNDPGCDDRWDFSWLKVQNKTGNGFCKCPVLNSQSN